MEQNEQKKDLWKDRWYIAYKNFLHISYLGGFVFFLLLILRLVKVEEINASITIWNIIVMFIVACVWYYLAQIFKRRDKKAIPLGYTVLSVMLVLNLYQSGNPFAILVLAYLFYIVYKASKSEPKPPSV